MKENQNDILKKIAETEYAQGFVTDLEQDVFPKGLGENVIRKLSLRKEEPDWLLEFRLNAFRKWRTMK
ncbi:MAG TPA: Fe-S cluster assembly protein SufB, partial [Rikenellaceae bacterium]|nr:Fe-S cluster assembly protein SufB [Rikenellaceae bacterium]